MKLTKKDVRGVVVVSIHGRILGGPEESDKFHQFFKSIIEEDKTNIVVDLRRTSYANSIGIGLLIGAYTSAKNAGGDLVLAHVIDRIKNILTVTKLLLIFKTFEKVDEAVDYMLNKPEADKAAGTDSKTAKASAPPQEEKHPEL